MTEDRNQLGQRIVAELKAQNWSGALDLIERWCSIQPNDARGWYNRGYCLARLRRFDEAVTSLSRCLRIDPRFDKALTLRGKILEHVRRGSPSVRMPTRSGWSPRWRRQ